MKKKPCLNDIAISLQVSRSLVSFVLNGHGDDKGINRETQQRVREMALTLNYIPSHAARGLRLGTTQTIGLIVADISNRFYSRIARRVEEVASSHGYNLMFCSSSEDAKKEVELINMLRERNVDGIIISTTQKNATVFSRLRQDGFPYVLIDRYIPRLQASYVGVDNFGGAFRATEHLLNNGYRKIGMLKIRPSYISTIREREAGFRTAMKQHGIRVNGQNIREVEFEDVRGGVRRELCGLLKPPADIHALFAANNNIAIQCLDFLTDLNLRVPQDVALISFDDIDLFRFCFPPITAIAQPVEEIGEQAINMLLDQIISRANRKKTGSNSGGVNNTNEAKVSRVFLPVELIERRSCGGFLANSLSKISR